MVRSNLAQHKNRSGGAKQKKPQKGLKSSILKQKQKQFRLIKQSDFIHDESKSQTSKPVSNLKIVEPSTNMSNSLPKPYDQSNSGLIFNSSEEDIEKSTAGLHNDEASKAIDSQKYFLKPLENVKGSKDEKKTDKKSYEDQGIKSSSRLISEFHTIEKKLATTKDPIALKKLKIHQKIILGGLSNYQSTSSQAASKDRNGQTGSWFAKIFQKKITSDQKPEQITLLDVGAIEGTSYSNFDWIKTTCIDLNPKSPTVLKFDFFEFPIPHTKFDVVALSLVLNFVGDLRKRGEMIRHVHKYLKPFGILYIVLPLACLKNSRYLDNARFINILNSLGFKLVTDHDDENSTEESNPFKCTNKFKLPFESLKMSFWIFKRSGKDGLGEIDNFVSWPKVEIRKGSNRNNFCIKI
ncbi:putative methyltransferase-domain-containing protein [Phakopsora pachyrhizi]|uniref:25S rRNA adenine-N(1) methyltransferase n=1 Tax=Phakopsora pachyrhizi TaxID=170000 RepID=A0AAV0AGY9_PHAPC|nr:putative methyltransferase-domain-containing protein [Phakopsora pachyrhizi]CAH7667623.1 putative methyltransferase-domain-containing protein [Phakopsora pachyrhizi]